MRFRGAKHALGYAAAVQQNAAGMSTTSSGGTPPDRELASIVMGCLAAAGLDPHRDSGQLRDILAWAQNADGSQDTGSLGPILGRFTAELLTAGLLKERVEPVEVGKHVGPWLRPRSPETELAELRETKTDREALLEQLFDAHERGELGPSELTLAIAEGMGVSMGYAAKVRRDELGIKGQPGRPLRAPGTIDGPELGNHRDHETGT